MTGGKNTKKMNLPEILTLVDFLIIRYFDFLTGEVTFAACNHIHLLAYKDDRSLHYFSLHDGTRYDGNKAKCRLTGFLNM